MSNWITDSDVKPTWIDCLVSSGPVEVRWITYKCPSFATEQDGEQGWATVHILAPWDWCYYGPNGKKYAEREARCFNEWLSKQSSRPAFIDYQPLQWML